MRLTRLVLSGFRNLEDTSLQFPEAGVALIGRNAQGKSNLLEAIHYLETFRSFRGARDEDIVRFEHGFFRVEADLEDESGDMHTIVAAFQRSPRRKKVTLDGDEVSRLGDAIGLLATVLFTPEDIRLVRDGPGERRRFLDIVLSLNEPGYLKALQTFRQALSQRNAALRDPDGSASAFAWDTILIRSGAEVSWLRAQWVHEFSQVFGERYREVSGEAPAYMQYEPNIVGVGAMGSAEEVVGGYRAALVSSRVQESRRRMTVIGPHRDDLTFSSDGREGGRDFREYGSGGETRTLALVLRLLEVETARSRRGREPILLLDDVFAELDDERSRRVLGSLERLVSGQVIVTAPREGKVQFRDDVLKKWTVEGGEIRS